MDERTGDDGIRFEIRGRRVSRDTFERLLPVPMSQKMDILREMEEHERLDVLVDVEEDLTGGRQRRGGR